MPKTIHIKNIKIMEMIFVSLPDNNYRLSVLYFLTDDKDNQYGSKRIVIEKFTNSEKTKIVNVFQSVANKIKTLEKI